MFTCNHGVNISTECADCNVLWDERFTGPPPAKSGLVIKKAIKPPTQSSWLYAWTYEGEKLSPCDAVGTTQELVFGRPKTVTLDARCSHGLGRQALRRDTVIHLRKRFVRSADYFTNIMRICSGESTRTSS